MTASAIFQSPDHRVWNLDLVMVDALGARWVWDGAPFDAVRGPELVEVACPDCPTRLVSLAEHSGLHSMSYSRAGDCCPATPRVRVLPREEVPS